MHQNTPNYNSNTHFGPLWLPRGGLEGSKSNMAGAWFFLAKRVLFFAKHPKSIPGIRFGGSWTLVLTFGFYIVLTPPPNFDIL